MARATTRESLLPPLWIIVLVALGLFLWLLIALKEIVVLLVVGYSITYVMEPALLICERKKIPRGLGVVIITVSVLLVIVLLAITAIPTILKEYRELAQNLPNYVALARGKFFLVLEFVKEYLPQEILSDDGAVSVVDLLPSVGSDTINKILSGVFATLLKGYSITLTLINLALLPFIVFYLAVDFPRIHERALSLFPILQRDRVAKIAKEIDSYVSAFARGQMIVGFILFLLYAAGLGAIRVELWFLLAVISGFGNMIPYLGFLVGIVLTTIMALVTFGDIGHLLLVWGLFAVVQFLEGTFITPKVLGDKVGLSPLVVILAIVAGGSLFGLLGVFLAIPGAAALRVLASHFHDWLVGKV
ncbi:AI-2E family transporter [Oligoflexia bacterium]|nr:AI-2E family transporter [Oligoflexia bacterium]